jgi:putative spermidine/putrescine transport system substrate-binding protein
MTEKHHRITGSGPRVSRRQVLLAGATATGAWLMGRPTLPLATSSARAAEPDKPEEMYVRAWGGNWAQSMEEAVSKPFTEKTGIRVVTDTTFHMEMKTKIWQAQAQNRLPPVHVNWDVSDIAYESALHGSCVDLSDLSNLSGMRKEALPQGVPGVPYVSMYTYVYALTYVPSKFPDGTPDTWQVLLEPRFKGRVGLYSSGNGIVQMAEVVAGGTIADYPDNMEAGWDFIEKVRGQDPLLGKDEDMTKWFQQGEVDVACNILTNAIDLKKNGAEIAWTVPKEGAYAAQDCLWVPKGFPDNETYWAKQYVNFAMTKSVNQAWCDALGLPGLHKDFEAPPEFQGDPAYPTTQEQFDHLIIIPTKIKNEHWDDWVLRYKSIMNI